MLVPVRTIPPSEYPVSLEDVKEFLHIDHDDDDAVIEGLIAGATDRLDGYGKELGRALVDQEWSIKFDDWPNTKIRIPLVPVTQIVSVTYWDDATPSVQGTWADSNFALLEDERGPYVAFLTDADFPSLASREDAIEILFNAGYGEAADVPEAIRVAIKQTVAHWFENREAVVVGDSAAPLPMSAQSLIHMYRRLGV